MGCAQLTWLLDDVGIPQDWRHLEGNSVNTYLFINAQGKERYFKMRWLPEGGARLPFQSAWLRIQHGCLRTQSRKHMKGILSIALLVPCTEWRRGCVALQKLVRCWLGGAVDLVVNLRAYMLAGAYCHLRNSGIIAWYQCM